MVRQNDRFKICFSSYACLLAPNFVNGTQLSVFLCGSSFIAKKRHGDLLEPFVILRVAKDLPQKFNRPEKNKSLSCLNSLLTTTCETTAGTLSHAGDLLAKRYSMFIVIILLKDVLKVEWVFEKEATRIRRSVRMRHAHTSSLTVAVHWPAGSLSGDSTRTWPA